MSNPHLLRIAGTEHLRDWLTQAASIPDPTIGAEVVCPNCGSELSISRGMHTGNWLFLHPTADCPESATTRHIAAPDRAQAIAAFHQLDST